MQDFVLEGVEQLQQFCCLYPLEEAFAAGTIFRELDKPFTGVCGCE